MACAVLVLMGVAGVTAWALNSRPPLRPAQAEAVAPLPPRLPEPLVRLPRDYAAPPRDIPRLGRPLPGDLGRPILAQQSVTPSPPTASEAAGASRLFAAGPTPAAAYPATSASTRPEALRRPETVGEPPRPGPTLRAGTLVRAALLTGVRADLPGPVLAQVVEDVVEAGRTAVPSGSRLLGAYDSPAGFGQDRVRIAWTALQLADGRTVALDREPAVDALGRTGAPAAVDAHWGGLAAAALVSAGLGAAGALAMRSDAGLLVQALRGDGGGGAQVVERSLQVKPALTLAPGAAVGMMLTHDVTLPE